MGFTAKTSGVLLRVYKLIISPVLHFLSLSTVGGGCRFYPSCSEYSHQTIKKYGLGFKAIKLILGRLLRCQPIPIKNKKNSGYDPVL